MRYSGYILLAIAILSLFVGTAQAVEIYPLDGALLHKSREGFIS